MRQERNLKPIPPHTERRCCCCFGVREDGGVHAHHVLSTVDDIVPPACRPANQNSVDGSAWHGRTFSAHSRWFQLCGQKAD